MKRPNVVEAYRTHRRTPMITERLANGKIRKVGRRQLFGENGWEREQAELLATYGDRWTGVKVKP